MNISQSSLKNDAILPLFEVWFRLKITKKSSKSHKTWDTNAYQKFNISFSFIENGLALVSAFFSYATHKSQISSLKRFAALQRTEISAFTVIFWADFTTVNISDRRAMLEA